MATTSLPRNENDRLEMPPEVRTPGVKRDTLKAVAENRSVYTDGTLAGALYFISPLSLPYVLERLTPMLEAAVAGEAPQQVAAERG